MNKQTLKTIRPGMVVTLCYRPRASYEPTGYAVVTGPLTKITVWTNRRYQDSTMEIDVLPVRPMGKVPPSLDLYAGHPVNSEGVLERDSTAEIGFISPDQMTNTTWPDEATWRAEQDEQKAQRDRAVEYERMMQSWASDGMARARQFSPSVTMSNYQIGADHRLTIEVDPQQLEKLAIALAGVDSVYRASVKVPVEWLAGRAPKLVIE